MLSEVLTSITQVGMVMFIVGSMAAMGLGLTLERMVRTEPEHPTTVPPGPVCKPMKPKTAQLWAKQDQHEGDRERLFRAVAKVVEAHTVFYPGCYVDVAPSFVFDSVTYLDLDKRTPGFFADTAGVREIVAQHGGPAHPEITFIHADYTSELDLPDEHFDLLVSLYAGFISEHCTRYLRVGGNLLVNPSHGDAAMASIDPRYRLEGAILARSGGYHVDATDLEGYLVPKKPQAITAESLHQTRRGVGYTKSPFAYLFTRIR